MSPTTVIGSYKYNKFPSFSLINIIRSFNSNKIKVLLNILLVSYTNLIKSSFQILPSLDK